MPFRWRSLTQDERKEAVSASDALESTEQKYIPMQRWIQEHPKEEPWTGIQSMNKTGVLKASISSLVSSRTSESGKSPGQIPPKGPQAEQERSADSAAPPEDEYKLSIRPLVFQLYQLCSAVTLGLENLGSAG